MSGWSDAGFPRLDIVSLTDAVQALLDAIQEREPGALWNSDSGYMSSNIRPLGYVMSQIDYWLFERIRTNTMRWLNPCVPLDSYPEYLTLELVEEIIGEPLVFLNEYSNKRNRNGKCFFPQFKFVSEIRD